mmetsp:Transcript_1359/g.3648  ORF Transcript_1359/g.3648 Transcript_1359/m.3648 type:complete len:679 (-) Transcript_1359:38-2074(-)
MALVLDAAADAKIQELLLQSQIGEALTLFNSHVRPEDSDWLNRSCNFHAAAGWAYFQNLSFAQACQHFVYAPEAVAPHLLGFWRQLLPAGWEPPPSGCRGCELAPQAVDIEAFVQAQMRAKASGGLPVSATAQTSTVAAANLALSSFLLKHRSALQAQERSAPEAGGKAEPSTDGTSLLQAVDTLALKLLVEVQADDSKLQELLAQNPCCIVEDCENFLKSRGRSDLLAHLWKARRQYEHVLQEWSQLLRTACAAGGSARSLKEQAVQEMTDALIGAMGSANARQSLQQYVPELLAVDPTAVLPVFTGAHTQFGLTSSPLSVDEVVQLIGDHEQLTLGYLEAMLQRPSHLEQKHKVHMGMLYLSQVKEELRVGVDMGPMRCKLLEFLEQADDVGQVLLPKVQELRLHQECVVLLCKEQRHSEALRVLVEVLDDLQHAETYCLILALKQAQLRGAADQVPRLFGADPHPSIRAVAFRQGDETDQSFPRLSRPNTTVQEAPLFLLLQALVDAHHAAQKGMGAYKRSADDYRSSSVHLLTTYAGHRDLPPGEVLKLLPSTWTLANLAEYLSKAGRFAVHERRVSMLEENLSSMAYLKTFTALAQERMRKVSITGDRCCPVCNSRFVGKDAVSKAFAAYPNETCVHVHCQQDASVCPKTGRDFAESASVYGYALGQSATDVQ